jgi:hypothetical protein
MVERDASPVEGAKKLRRGRSVIDSISWSLLRQQRKEQRTMRKKRVKRKKAGARQTWAFEERFRGAWLATLT